MRKHQISPTPSSVSPPGQTWLNVDRSALVEVTSEENGYPIESALLGDVGRAKMAMALPFTQLVLKALLSLQFERGGRSGTPTRT